MKRFTVTDGKLVLTLHPADEGGYVVTSPFDLQLITHAETLEEAFANAHDAAVALQQSRRKLLRRRAIAGAENASAPTLKGSKLTRRR